MSTGIYEVDFIQPATANSTNPTTLAVSANWPAQASADNWVTAWDVTVFDGNVAQSGRVFARYYALNLGSANARVNLDVIVQTIDGYRYELEQDIEPFGFIFFANRKGFRDGEGNAIYRSIQLNDDDTLQPGQTFNAPDQPDDIDNNEVTHKIFLNEPDGSMPATAATPSGTDTWLYRPDAKAPPIPQDFAFTGVDGTQDQAGTGLGGTFSFVNPLDGTDDAPAPNAYNITLEFSSGATKRVLAGTADPDVTTEVFWDGQDGDGNDVPAGSGDFTATVRLFAGEVHFPFLDVEDAPTGISITRLNTPAGSATTGIADPGRIYYDDSIFTNGQKELDGIITPPAAHTFTGDFGNHRGIDTWVYYPTSEPEQASIVIREADLSVAMTDNPDPILAGGPTSYTFTVSNLSDGSAGTVDAVDAAVTDAFPAELTNVQWRCEITAEGTFANEPLAASSCAINSGAGDISTTVNLKRGATATFTVTATVAQNASGILTNTATVGRGTDASDPDASNNEASETTTIDANPGVAGSVFDDANGDGIFDASESGLAGVTVVLYDSNANSCRAAQTNAAGDYVFTNVADGSYQLIEAASETVPTPAACPPAEEDPAGYGSTTANTLNVNVAGSSLFAQNFGDTTGFDYGDAPATYTEAEIVASDNIYLGSTPPDIDAGNWHDGVDDSQNATDDDTNDTPSAFTAGSGEEDSVIFGPLDYTMAGETFSQDVSVTNDSASPAYVRGWIDFDRNGTFDADEVSDEVTVAANAGTTTANVTFNIPANSANTYDGINPGPSFARVIVSDTPNIPLTGQGAGEVEDLRVNIADVDFCTFAPGETFSGFDFTNVTGLTNDASGARDAVALFENAAVAPDGTPLDVRMTVNMPSGRINSFGNGTLNQNVEDTGAYLSITGDSDQDYAAEVRLEFLLANTSVPYAVSGQFSTNDIDGKSNRTEALLLNIESFDGFALGDPTTIRAPYVEGDYTAFTGTGDRDSEPDSAVVYTFSNQTRVDLIVRGTDIVGETTAGFGINGRLASQQLGSPVCSSIPPPADYGDAPASYGDAGHAVSQMPELYLGAVAPDEESQPQNAANGGADGTGDDANGTDDEDAFDTLPPLATDSSSYTLEVPLTNPSSAATLYGWVDFDGDGRFSASEAATANVAAGASTATLSWNSANGNAPANLSEGTTFARLRLTTDSLTDEASTTSQDERASVAATDGEGEDYPVEVLGRVYTCPTARADLWFANDESGSVSDAEFNDALDFLYQISDEFIYDDVTGVKAGVTAWINLENSLEVVMPITETFGDPGDSGLIGSGGVTTDGDGRGLRELYSARQNPSGRGTRLDYATNYLADLIIAGNGRRADTPQVAVILTDANEGQLTVADQGGGSAWIDEANRLRNAGPDGTNILVIVTQEAAAAYSDPDSEAKSVVDAVAGANGLVLVVPTYVEAAEATNGYVQQTVNAICELTTREPTPEIDLELTQAAPSVATQGESVTFTLTLENKGPDSATGIEVTDLLPSGLTFQSASSTNYNASTGVWNVGALASGDSVVLEITATVDEGVPAQIINSAEVTAAEQTDTDSTPDNRADAPDEDDTVSATLDVYSLSPNEGNIVINEVLFDQSRSGNVSAANNDEFIELYNAGDITVDLSGWELIDANLIAGDFDGPNGNINGAEPYTFPATQLAPGEYAIIWIGQSAASRDAPTAAFQTWLGRNIRLKNSGDDVWLYDNEGRIVDYIAYGNDTAVNTPPPASLGLWDPQYNANLDSSGNSNGTNGTVKGQSISLTPNGADSNTSACWEPTASGEADGRCASYLPTIDSDAREDSGTQLVTSVAQNNNAFISGTLFYDDGLENGDANNAFREGSERGAFGIVVTVTDGADTVSTTTDGAGNYSLIVPGSFSNKQLTLSHSRQPTTGYNDGTDEVLAAVYADADAASVTFSFTGSSVTYNFGVARPSTLRPDQNGQVGPGSAISYTHLFTPGTLGEVSLSVSGTYSYQVFRDVDCDGIVQPDEQADVIAAGFDVDNTWPRTEAGALAPCALELRVFVPEGEASGRIDLATLSANLAYADNSAVVDSVSVTDVTTVTTGGQLELTKRVANVTQGADFGTVGEGEPGDVLEYCISYRNLGTETLTQTLFSDPVPFFTTFVTGAYNSQDILWTHNGAEKPLSATTNDDEGELSSGVVQVDIGEVAAGEAGEVCYRVRIR